MKYEGNIYRPPSEAYSLLIQVTVSCSHNRCTFCNAYKGVKFRIKSREEILEDIGDAEGCPEGVGGVGVAEVMGEDAVADQSGDAAQQDPRRHQRRVAPARPALLHSNPKKKYLPQRRKGRKAYTYYQERRETINIWKCQQNHSFSWRPLRLRGSNSLYSLPWQNLYFFPLPHGHGSFRPTFAFLTTVFTAGAPPPSPAE